MFYVSHQNKVFVQFQLFDFFPELIDLWRKQNGKVKFSKRLNRYMQIKDKKRTRNKENKEKKLRQRDLYDFLKNKQHKIIKNAALKIEQDTTSPSEQKVMFNLIPTNIEKREVIYTKELEGEEVIFQNNSGNYSLDGYIGKYISSTILILERGGLPSRYVAGLIHMIYLKDFNIFENLEAFGITKSGGFTVRVMFLTLYYIYFIMCNSIERFTHVNSEEFSILINNLSKPQPDSIRKFLKRTITLENALTFSNFIYYYINRLDNRIGIAAYIDEHLVKYQGTKKMAKGKGGGKNKFEKGFYRFYLTCSLFSIPIFNMPKDGRERLEKVIFKVLENYQLVVKKKILILIFDRGIKSFKTLKKLHQRDYNFVCWSFPYKTIEEALKRRSRLKMVKLSGMMNDLITIREKSCNELKLDGRDAEVKGFFESVLPTNDLKEELRNIEKKEKGIKKWNNRDFVGMRDVQIEFKDYGLIRAIILEKVMGERIAILTDVRQDLAHPIEILMVLKKKQKIENYFSYKRAIQGDYIPFWELEESKLQKTKFNYEITKPDQVRLEKFEKKKKRIKNDLKKIDKEFQKWKKRFKKGKINKKTLNKMEKGLTQQEKHKTEELKEIHAFIKWAKKGRKPGYFEKIEPIMELNPKIEIFLNAINDLFFVNSRRIASDLGNSLKLAKINHEVTLSDNEIKEISNYTPEKLNDILLKGGGKVLINPNNKLEIFIELHTELLHKDEKLIVPYLKMLNTLGSEYLFYHNTNYSIKFTYYLLRLPKLVKVV